MNILIAIIITLSTFVFMEGVAWFTHKYVMHGFLWSLHRDHHQKDVTRFFERNDFFFLLFATPGVLLTIFGSTPSGFDYRFWIGIGITLYGSVYFLVHDIFIHQRFKFLQKTNNTYFKAARKAHAKHHYYKEKHHGRCFGMLFFPKEFFKK